jgi:hypothetical protein
MTGGLRYHSVEEHETALSEYLNQSAYECTWIQKRFVTDVEDHCRCPRFTNYRLDTFQVQRSCVDAFAFEFPKLLYVFSYLGLQLFRERACQRFRLDYGIRHTSRHSGSSMGLEHFSFDFSSNVVYVINYD